MEGNRTHSADHWDIAEEIAELVYRNLDRRVPLDEIARRCRFSPFYLNRLFRSVVGESIYEFEKRSRLGRAASRLIKEGGTSVTEIAADAGYSPSNFAVAFKEAYGRSPTVWRIDPTIDAGAPPFDEYAAVLSRIAALRTDERREEAEKLGRSIQIERLQPFTLYRRRYRGPFAGLGGAWDAFCPEAETAIAADEARNGRFGGNRRWIGVSYEDPLVARPDRFAYDLCVEVAAGYGRRFLRVEGGTYARFDWRGAADRLKFAFNDLFGVAMPARNLRMAQRGLCLEVYRRAETPDDFDISIYAPLELDEV
jgi:AraC family transcriptional regulator